MLDQSPLSRLLVVVPISLLALVLASAQVRPERTRRLITQAVDESKRVELPGNTIPQANTGNDRGRVPDSLPMEHMQLQLRLPREKEAELDNCFRRSKIHARLLTTNGLLPSNLSSSSAWLPRTSKRSPTGSSPKVLQSM